MLRSLHVLWAIALAVALGAACAALGVPAPVPSAPPAATNAGQPIASAGPVPAGAATAAPQPSVVPPPAAVAPAGPSCVERLTIPDIADAVAVAWSPDGHTLAVSHTVPLPSAQVTGSPEDFFLDALDLRTGALTPLGLGERMEWSKSGRYLAYWGFQGDLRIARGGLIVASGFATVPAMRWVGDALVYLEKDRFTSWSEGRERIVSTLDPAMVPTYPRDDLSFSADAERFLITRYQPDGTARLYSGTTATGGVTELGAGATYAEWAPTGARLLVRYADRIEIRDGAGVASAPLAALRGPVHQWTADGRLLFGTVSPAPPGVIAFDAFDATDGAAMTLPDLLGPRSFSPDGRVFAGVSRTGARATRLELFRCVASPVPPSLAIALAPSSEDVRSLRPVVGAITQTVTATHTGIDIAAPFGALVVAPDVGVVSAVGAVPVGGRRVCVRHPSAIETCAYHTSAALVSVGQRVARGEPIALVGLTGVTTGPHVHWEAMLAGRIVDPLTR